MSGLSSDMEWGEPADQGDWRPVSSELLLLAVGVSWALLWVASLVSSPLYLAIRMHDRAADQAGDDL